MIIRKGDNLFFTDGDYSDYGIRGLYVAMRTFAMEEVVVFFKKKYPHGSKDNGCPRHSAFEAFLIEEGYIDELESKEIWYETYENWGNEYESYRDEYIKDRDFWE